MCKESKIWTYPWLFGQYNAITVCRRSWILSTSIVSVFECHARRPSRKMVWVFKCLRCIAIWHKVILSYDTELSYIYIIGVGYLLGKPYSPPLKWILEATLFMTKNMVSSFIALMFVSPVANYKLYFDNYQIVSTLHKLDIVALVDITHQFF